MMLYTTTFFYVKSGVRSIALIEEQMVQYVELGDVGRIQTSSVALITSTDYRFILEQINADQHSHS
jgi:hypothetical protein